MKKAIQMQRDRIANVDPREEWLMERRTGIGGSDVGAIAGLSPYASPLDVYLDKTGVAEPIPDNINMEIGRRLESVVADMYADRTGRKIERRHSILRHKTYPFMLANLDRVIYGDPRGTGVLEIKTAGRITDDWGEAETDQVPLSYLAQVLWYMAVTGYQWAHLACLFLAEREFRIYHINRDEDAIQSLIDTGKQFWEEHVKAKTPPDATNAADVLRRWPQSLPQSIDADGAIRADIDNLITVRNQIKELKQIQDGLEFSVKSYMEDNEALTAEGRTLATWKTQARKAIDTKRLKEELPELAAKYTKETTNRVLRIK